MTPSRVIMIELGDWILMVSADDHEMQVGSIERVMVDSGAAASVCPLGYALEVLMSNHSRRGTLRTACGAQMEHAGQKMVGYCGRDQAVGGGWRVAQTWNDCGDGSTWKLRDSRSSWMRLTRGENGMSSVAPVDLGDAVPTSKDLSELPSVEDAIQELVLQLCRRSRGR